MSIPQSGEGIGREDRGSYILVPVLICAALR